MDMKSQYDEPDKVLPESQFTPPRAWCEHPEWWHSWNDDGNATEIEVVNLICGFISAIQPEFVVETGTALGRTALAMANALTLNGHGRMVTLEIDPKKAEIAKKYCFGAPVQVICIDSFQYHPPQSIDFIWIDSKSELRSDEFLYFKQFLSKGAVVGFHDTGAHRNPPVVLPKVMEYINPISLNTPRGCIFGQLK